MRDRDSLKKKANLSNDPQIWQQCKQSRNQINNKIKEVKRNYFTNNLDLHKGDMKKTWQLINEISSKNTGKTNRVSELNFNSQEITEPVSIAESFNNYFSSVGDNLAATIPTPDHDPGFYFKATDKVFSLQIPTFETVFKLLSKIDEKKLLDWIIYPTNY